MSSNMPLVDVKQGKLLGEIKNNINGGQYFSFTGVPYAEPPVGKLRFQEPQPLRPWTDIKNVVEECKASAQYMVVLNEKEGGDDCLYLNIATNSISGKRPVMVWIHGGGFKLSSNSYKKYSPDYLLKKDIVFVSMNYRLGVLGFLNMEHEECAGNQGLKDQVCALKWIQENIEVFGGDSRNITIFGESAGAASVHALCLSSQAKGLFHKAIMQSGAISNPWAHTSSNKEKGYSLAKSLGKECSNASEVVEFLRTIPPLKLVEKYECLNPTETADLSLALVPTIDNKSPHPILPQSIQKMEKGGIDVPLLLGYNSHEGIIKYLKYDSTHFKKMQNNFEEIVAENFKISNINKIPEIVAKVRDFYFDNEEITEKKINEMVHFFGDILFVINILGVVDIQQQKDTPTYLYKYCYSSNFPGLKERFNVKLKGVCHSDENGCLFYSEQRRGKLKEGTRDYMAMERMTTMWTNFAKTGNPTPNIDKLITTTWLPVEKNTKHYLEINDNLICGEDPDKSSQDLWKTVTQIDVEI